MEHPGAITYTDFLLLLEENASAAQKSILIQITAHQLAHQWYGNLVTMQRWDELWLNESYEDWIGDKTAVAVFPDLAIE
jgi:alanyl aminopeptidase